MAKDTTAAKGDSSGGIGAFLGDCREELRKVSHPSREVTIRATLVTIVIMVFVSLVLAFADGLFDWLSKRILS